MTVIQGAIKWEDQLISFNPRSSFDKRLCIRPSVYT